VRNAIRSRLARRKLAELLVSSSLSKKDGEKEGGPVVTGIYIHPGERVLHECTIP
jgi:hypothetical protein